MDKKILFLIILSFFLFFWRIGSIPILDGDTASAAKIAKNIIETNDWLTMRYSANPAEIVSKPPLFYWVIAAGFKLFGINEFGLSFFHSIFGVLTVLLTYFIAKELFNQKTALWSAIILLTSAQFFYQARSPLYDIPLTFFIACAFYSFILFEKYKKYSYYYLIAFFAAAAVLTKGPVGFVLIVLVLVLYTAWNKSIKQHLNIHLFLCLCLCLCLSLPWFIAEYKILGQPFLDIFWSSNFVRFFHPVDSISNDPNINTAVPQFDFYSYLLQLLLVFAPWSGFLYPAIFSKFKEKESRFIISWIVGILLFFSLSLHYKISRYILPVFPALSIITAKFLEDSKESRLSKNIYGFLIAPFFCLAAIYLAASFPKNVAAYYPIIIPFLAVFSAGILFGAILLFMKKTVPALIGFSLFALISYLVLIPCLDIFFKVANPIKEFCLTVNQLANGSDRVILYKTMSSSHFAGFYLDLPYQEIYSKEALGKLKKEKLFVITEDVEAVKSFPNAKIISQKSNFVLFSSI